jgi:hypothetical protein
METCTGRYQTKSLPEIAKYTSNDNEVEDTKVNVMRRMIIRGDVDTLSKFVTMLRPGEINERDMGGATALHYAAGMNNLEAVSMLLLMKASRDISTSGGQLRLVWTTSAKEKEQLLWWPLKKDQDIDTYPL